MCRLPDCALGVWVVGCWMCMLSAAWRHTCARRCGGRSGRGRGAGAAAAGERAVAVRQAGRQQHPARIAAGHLVRHDDRLPSTGRGVSRQTGLADGSLSVCVQQLSTRQQSVCWHLPQTVCVTDVCLAPDGLFRSQIAVRRPRWGMFLCMPRSCACSCIKLVWRGGRTPVAKEQIGVESTSDAQVKLLEGGVSLHWQPAGCAARTLRPGSPVSRLRG